MKQHFSDKFLRKLAQCINDSATQLTYVSLVSQIVQRNTSSREDALSAPVDGLELFMDFIIRQYRRGIQVTWDSACVSVHVGQVLCMRCVHSSIL